MQPEQPNNIYGRRQLAQSLRTGAEFRLQLWNQADAIMRVANVIARCLHTGGKLLLMGNGGSAADAQHLAAEFVGRFSCERQPLPALALTTDTSLLTAVANDYGFDQIFARQITALARPGDVVIGISTSGNSANVLRGMDAARAAQAITIGFTGAGDNALATMADYTLFAPSTNVARIQECHITLGHLICELVDADYRQIEPEPADGAGSAEIMSEVHKVMDWESLLALRAIWRAEGKTVAWTNGCFDLWHAGHVRSLQAAKRFGDKLIVGLNSDYSVRQLKGPERPMIPQDQRAEMLAALECVDAVVLFDELTPELALARLQPDIHCKGADYAPPDGKPVPERHLVESYGGKVVFTPMIIGLSSTELISKIRLTLS